MKELFSYYMFLDSRSQEQLAANIPANHNILFSRAINVSYKSHSVQRDEF